MRHGYLHVYTLVIAQELRFTLQYNYADNFTYFIYIGCTYFDELSIIRSRLFVFIPSGPMYPPIGRSRGRAGCMPPYGTQFFHFCKHFCQKVSVSEVHIPPNGFTPALREILDPPLPPPKKNRPDLILFIFIIFWQFI